jgi:5-methylcytosine-specific restriction protein A
MAWKRGSPAERGYGRAWQKLRKAMLAQEPLCRACREQGVVTAATDLDHIVPKAEGGTDDPANLQALCADCHKDKTARESARAQGRTPKPRLTFGTDGWPVTRNNVTARRKEARG